MTEELNLIKAIEMPEDASPHEIAILYFFIRMRSARRVADFMRYKSPRQVQKVLSAHREFLSEVYGL